MSIKRYRVVQSYLDEWPTGSWVKYDDHLAEVECLTAERDGLAKAARGLLYEADRAAKRLHAAWTEEEAQELEHLRAALAALPKEDEDGA